MKKLIVLAVAALSISACSTSQNTMRSSTPDQLFSSQQKDAKEISVCIADKWQEETEISSKEMTNGYSVSALISGKLGYLAKIENQGSGSITKLYKFELNDTGAAPLLAKVGKFMSTGTGSNLFFAAASECQYQLLSKAVSMSESELREKLNNANNTLNALYQKEEQGIPFTEDDQKIKDVIGDVILFSKELQKLR